MHFLSGTSRFLAGIMLSLIPAGAAHAAVLPSPIVEFRFENGLANTGSGGGAATLKVYAETDAPVLMPGPWGRCLDLSESSRFGGRLPDDTPAGAALFWSNRQLDRVNDFTVTFWMRCAPGERGIAARIMTKPGSWEILYIRGAAALYATGSRGKRRYGPPLSACDRRGTWTFAAITVDSAGAAVRIAVGNAETGLDSAEYDLIEPIPHAETALEIGNFRGIRPFKGLLDNVRIYPAALSIEQVRARFEADLADRTPPDPVYTCGVLPPPPRRFGFRKSAIPFSSRWQKRGKQREDLFRLLEEYHATHLLWVYGTDPAFVRAVKDLGLFYEGTLNGMAGAAQSGRNPDATRDRTGRARDFDGRKFVPSHMERWPDKWRFWRGCHNSPDFRRIFWKGADGLVRIGCDAIHVDDWEMTVVPAATGRGCFCPHCLQRFRDYLRATRSPEELRRLGVGDVDGFDYRAYLREKYGITNANECRKRYRTVFRSDPLARLWLDAQRAGLRDFYRQLRRHLDAVSPDKYIPVSVNNQFFRRAPDGRFRGWYCTDVVDFFIGEASRVMQSAEHFIHCCKLAEGFGIPQVMMCKPVVLGKAQAAMATTYALGAWMRVPWDVYMDNDPRTGRPAPRYYGRIEDWGPLYDFVHDHPRLFDGFESAASVAVVIQADSESVYSAFWSLLARLARAQVQFRVIPAADGLQRIPLHRDTLLKFTHVILLSPEESFCNEDRRTLESVRQSLLVRFLAPDADVEDALVRAGRKLIRLEAPANVYAFLRVRPGAAVLHLVNWNVSPNGRADPLGHVTVQLLRPERWGADLRALYYRPGRAGGEAVEPERHADMIRITVPRLDTWGVIEITPASGSTPD